MFITLVLGIYLPPNTLDNYKSKMLVSLIMAKLPKDVLIHLTDQKHNGNEGTVQLLRDQLHRYFSKRENADRQSSQTRLETRCLQHRSPSLILTVLLMHYCLKPNYLRVLLEERK